MKVGLTFDLRSWYIDRGYSMEDTAEFDKENTIEALEAAIQKTGLETERIGNAFQLIEELAKGKKWDLVFNIAEGLFGDGRESVVPAILDQYRIPYVFSGPVILGISLNKYIARLIVSSSGIPVSPGILLKRAEEAESCNLHYPLFVKPVSEGTGKGITEKNLVNNPPALREITANLISRFEQPVLVEEYLPGREFTVGIIGTGEDAVAVGGMEIICRDNLPYSVEFKENYKEFCKYIPMNNDYADESKQVALEVWKAIGGLDAGRVDVKADRNGRICFMEVNPLAGLHPIDSDLPILAGFSGIGYEELIERIIRSAAKRYDLIL
jgi:D-alanine-D-alanine ligase